MPTSAIQTSRAVGRLLKEKRKALRLTLREVSDLTAREGERIPTSTLARVETGALDPGVRRLNLLLRLYRIPAQFAADIVELERTATELPEGKSASELYRDGVEAWKRGDHPGGLAHLLVLRRLVPRDDETRLTRQKGTLGFAIAAYNLGKIHLARELVGELLAEPPDPTVVFHTLLHASSVWLSLRSTHSAMAYLREAETLVGPEDLASQAWLFHQQGRVLSRMGRHAEGEAALSRALEAYRGLGDATGEGKALLALARVVEALGERDRALGIAREALGHARENGHAPIARMALLEVGRFLVAAGDIGAGEDSLREALGQAILEKDRHAEFLAHYHLWKTHASIGDTERAAFELEAARHYVTFIDEASPEADEVRGLNEVGALHAQPSRRRRRHRS